MPRILGCLLLSSSLCAVSPHVTLAGPNANAAVMLHVGPVFQKGGCSAGRCCCNQIEVAGGLYPPNLYYTYLLVLDYDVVTGIAGLQCGISYPGSITVFGWYPCAPSEVSTDTAGVWPASGSGARWSWDANSTDPNSGCQLTGAGAVAGYFYMGAYDPGGRITITPHPDTGKASVVSCTDVEDKICGLGDIASPCTGVSRLGAAEFNTAATGGYTPCGFSHSPAGAGRFPPCDACGQTPTERISWGTIKATYGSTPPRK